MLLDTGPLGLVTHPEAATKNQKAAQWLRNLLSDGVDVLIPELADYELRRELLRAGKTHSVAVLDRYKATLGYVPSTTEALLQAAEFWATARQQEKPMAPDLGLDGDAILAAQAAVLGRGGDDVMIATTNEGHLSRFVPAQEWEYVSAT